jgi:hypothetical protein
VQSLDFLKKKDMKIEEGLFRKRKGSAGGSGKRG